MSGVDTHSVKATAPYRRRQPVFIFLRLFLPLAAIVIGAAVYFGLADAEQELARVAAAEKVNLGVGSGVVTRDLHWVTRDLAYLAKLATLRAAINMPTPPNLQRLGADFTTFARTQQDYPQIRWIDETGRERLRVDYSGGRYDVVPDPQLQDKSKRYFFAETVKLAPGEVYVSPLDLATDNDVVNIPYEPTIRVGTPVVDDQGVNRGGVLLNCDAKQLLHDFATATAGVADHVMLLNSDGYWLHSQDRAEEWGFMFNRSETLGSRHPVEWGRIKGDDRGQFETAAGLWTFDTIYPLRHANPSGADAPAIAAGRRPLEPSPYVWKSVAHITAGELASIRNRIYLSEATEATLMLILLGLGCWQLTRAAELQTAAEDTLRRRTGELEEAQRIAGVGNWEWIADSGRVTGSNEAYRIHGRDPASGPLSPIEIATLLLPASRRPLKQATDLALQSGAPFELDLQIVRAGEASAWATVRGEPMRGADGRITGLRGTVHDISERKRVEEALVEAHKLEAVGQLTGGLAHDFNNLIGIIRGNLDLLEPLLAHDEKARRHHALACRAGQRAAQVTKSLLAVARKQALAPRTLDVVETVAEMMPLINDSVGSQITVTESRSDNCAAGVFANVDPAGLGNVILNLAINARDAMPAGGELHIDVDLHTVRRNELGAPPDLASGRYIVLSAADNGVGMSPEVLAKAFVPFFTTKERGQGTGLGLAMVYGFARQSGGTATIVSQPGLGTTVHLYLPACAGAIGGTSLADKPTATLPAGNGEKILVVDDEEMLLEVTHEWLRRLGYRVEKSATPAEALEILGAEPFDLLLTDVTMPGMSGLELAQKATARRPGIGVALVSGFAGDLLPGAWPLLEKPFSRDQLARFVRRALAARTSADSGAERDAVT